MQQSALKQVLNKIQSVAVQKPVLLVAVSKTKPVAELKAVYEEGQRDFGENYVDELLEKAPLLAKDVRWHFIGHLQSNKVAQLLKIKNLESIQTVDSLKLAQKVAKHCEALDRDIKVFIQVKLSEEVSKSGVTEEESRALVREIVEKLLRLRLVGLMTIGPQGDLSVFKRLAQLRDNLEKEFNVKLQLSMGMSGDYVEAIQAGADVVRVGSAIFGERVQQH